MVFSGDAQILGGGFRILAIKEVNTGRADGKLIKTGHGFRIDTGAMWRLYMCILSSGNFPIGAIIAGFVESEYKFRRKSKWKNKL